MTYREIKGGSILTQIRKLNSREDCCFTGEFKLISPRPYGEGCGEFLTLCNYANRLPENRFETYSPEQILTYEPVTVDTDPYDKAALRGNPLNAHEVRLVDLYLKSHIIEVEYTVDSGEYGYEPHTLKLPVHYIVSPLQFVVTARVSNIFSQKVIASFSRNGAMIYELAKFANY